MTLTQGLAVGRWAAVAALVVLAMVSTGLAADATSAAGAKNVAVAPVPGSLLAQATPEQKKLYEEARPGVLAEASQKPLILTKESEGYFWRMAGRMTPLLAAYHYAKDPIFLETYVPLQEQVLSQRYLHPTRPEWSGWFDYNEPPTSGFYRLALIDHDTIIYYVPALMFVQEVRADPKLQAKYGAKADAWLKDVEASIRGWDKRGCWQDFPDGSGWYRIVSQYPDSKTGELKDLPGGGSGGVEPYNKVHALFQALSLAYRITGDPWYKTRMEKCCKFFRSHWRVDDKHAEWNYRDHAFPGDYVSGVVGQGPTRSGAFVHPKPGYYDLDVTGVVTAWDLGIFYQKADVEKLLQTNLEFMFLGDAKDPKFKMINGNFTAESAKNRNKGVLWTALAHFSQQTRDLWRTEIEANHKVWMWGANVVDYLIETSQPVSWNHRYVKDAAPDKK